MPAPTSTPTPAAATSVFDASDLAAQFRSDFGIKGKAKTFTTKPVNVGSRDWVFTLRSVEGTPDAMWTALNSRIFAAGAMGSEASQAGAQIATNISLEAAMVSAAVVGVNEIPLYKLTGVELTDGELSALVDPFDPPDRVRRAASKEFLRWIEEDRFDHSIVVFLKGEYDREFAEGSGSIKFPGRTRVVTHTFKCENPECSLIITLPEADVLARCESILKATGGVYCPGCSGTSKPPKGEEVASPNSPLGKLLGSKSGP